MSDHDHYAQELVALTLFIFVVGALIHAPCPDKSALAFTWMWPPYQCVQVVR